MPRPNSLVDGIQSLSPFREAAAGQGPMPPIDYRKVEFRGGRSGYLDMSIPRSRTWEKILDSRRQAGLPVYVEIDPETTVITDLLVPRTVTVGAVTEAPSEDRVYIELIISAVRHYIRRSNPDFDLLYKVLKTAARNGSRVLVTEALAGYEIIDVQTSPELLKGALAQKKPPAGEGPAPGPHRGPTTVSLQRAQQLFNLVAARSCDPIAVPPPCIPFLFPYNGCWTRAHEMCRLMIAEKEQPRKIWLYGSLTVYTRNWPPCYVTWGYHVAPTLEVDTGGVVGTYVIDPAIFTGPVPYQQWIDIQNDTSATPVIDDDAAIYYRNKDATTKIYDDALYTQTIIDLDDFRSQLQTHSGTYGPPPYSSCPITPDCFFILDRSTFGQDEVGAMLRDVNPGYPGNLTKPAVFPKACYVVVEGFRPSELGINTQADLINASLFPSVTISPAVAGMSIKPNVPADPVEPEDPSLPDQPQRFTFPYQIEFANENGFNFTGSDTFVVTLAASRTSTTGKTVTNSAAIELIKNANPFMIDGATSWLSTDLRVFQIKQNEKKFDKVMANDAPDFIKSVITNLNNGNGSAGDDTYEALPADQPGSSLALAQADQNGTPVFNFAVARVRLKGYAANAEKVRVFFRLFATQRTSMDYDYPSAGYPDAGSYRFWSDGVQYGKKIPLPGVIADEYVSVPCFAEGRKDTATTSMNQQTDAPNIRDINHNPAGEADAYYGCWLDINQPSKKVLPDKPPASSPDGPFSGLPLLSVLECIVKSGHQCLVAEVAFDLKAIPLGASPSTSDKLAQRNLAFDPIPNPGRTASRSISQTFEVRPTPLVLPEGQKPDELMIEWGNIPAGSVARIYLPAVNASEVLRMARNMYTSYRLLLVDDHTLRFPAAGVTYIPVPAGSGADYAGLLSVDFPPEVKRGQKYSVVVRQVTGSTRPIVHVPRVAGETAAAAARPASWRRIIGSFQITVPVQVKEELLIPEQRLLSILRWIQKSIPAESRWSPVFRRYLVQIAGRVDALGGDSEKVEASPTGDWQGVAAQQCRKWAWLSAALLAATAAAFGYHGMQAGLVIAGLFILSAAGWLVRCRPQVCGILRVLTAGAVTGALLLAILILSGNALPQVPVVIACDALLAAGVWLYGVFRKCW